MSKKNSKTSSNTICQNKKAKFDYHVEDKYEAGMCLLGWELKSIRAGKIQLVDSYVHIQNGELWLIGCHITPLSTACTHVIAEPRRARKLLLNKKEIAKLVRGNQQESHTVVALNMYWKGNKVKSEIALVKGKQDHDKRASIKEREWNIEKRRVLKNDH
ncbi:SsrA-binding protein SmpB [Marinicellulosiphila megalodicopiae]|uniref:SsrA-binding protein SmpB n=1 Tax=Marinicellulosiphila megalodicopiae TaxID=2724896 RepID=UPI003BB0E0AF